MTNPSSSERAQEAGKKKKHSFHYVEVPSDEPNPGTSDRDLGRCWGLDQGKSNLLSSAIYSIYYSRYSTPYLSGEGGRGRTWW